MILSRMFAVWDELVGAGAVLAMVILGLRVMAGDVKPGDALRHLGLVAGFVILLTMLPPIIRFQWGRLPFMNQLGFVVMVFVIVLVLGKARGRSQAVRKK